MTESAPPESNPPGPPDGGPESPPRAFVTATGLVFQVVGLVMLLGSCCFWSFSGRVLEPVEVPTEQWTDHFRGERLPAALLTLGVVTTFVGGIALTAAGVGLQGEIRGSGRAAMAVSVLMAVIYLAAGVMLIAKTSHRGSALVPIVFGLVTSVLFLLAGHSASVLRRFPPPADQHLATEEFLRKHKEDRLKRLEEYDP